MENRGGCNRNQLPVRGRQSIQIDGEPLTQFYCHCDDCQAVHGGAYIGVAIYPAQVLIVSQGDLASWRQLNRSGFAGDRLRISTLLKSGGLSPFINQRR
ncbi:MAG: GFA family protein [Nitrococcus mobilis]|nr:GFA family protein [Nitrococcus mobilis]